jgi:proteasome accessory factor C
MLNQHKILRVLQLIQLLKTAPAKNLRFLANVLKTTERTIYRYVDLIQEVGFIVERDEQNKLFISNNYGLETFEFTPAESDILIELLETSGKDILLKNSIINKIQIHTESTITSKLLVNAHLGKLVEAISNGIQLKKTITIKKYHSLHSNDISDRIVEPICFTDNYQHLVAFEVKSQKNKFFHIERMTAIEIGVSNWKFEAQHKFEKPDAFGFSPGEKVYSIKLKLSLKAGQLLKEEYPRTTEFLKLNKQSKTYTFITEVNSIIPIKRFIFGLQDEIEILEGTDKQLF